MGRNHGSDCFEAGADGIVDRIIEARRKLGNVRIAHKPLLAMATIRRICAKAQMRIGVHLRAAPVL